MYTHFKARIEDSLRQHWGTNVAVGYSYDPYATFDSYEKRLFKCTNVDGANKIAISNIEALVQGDVYQIEGTFVGKTIDNLTSYGTILDAYYDGGYFRVKVQIDDSLNLFPHLYVTNNWMIGDPIAIENFTIRKLSPSTNYKPIMLSTIEGDVIDEIPCLPLLAIPEDIQRAINPAETSTEASEIELTIYNPHNQFSLPLYERMNTIGTLFWNEKIELWGVLPSGVEKRLFKGLVSGISSDPMETEYSLTTSDIMQVIKTDLFSRELSEYTDIQEGISETIADINAFRMPLGFSVLEELEEPTEPADPSANPYIRRVHYQGHPIDFVYGILEMIYSTPTNKVGISYLNDNYTEFIDVYSFENVRTLMPSAYDNFEFDLYDTLDDPFGFFKEQIFKACVIFPFINNEGMLGLKFHQQPLGSEAFLTLDESTVIAIKDKTNSVEGLVNHIRIDYNNIVNKDEDKFTRTIYSIEPESLSKQGFLTPKGEPLAFQLQGINFNFSDPATQSVIVNNVSSSYFSRYANSVTEITLDTSMEIAQSHKVGDYVGLNHNTLVEWEGANAGQRGITGESIEPTDPTAHLNVGDHWSGFVYNNTLGKALDGYVFLETTIEEMQSELFTGATKSCVTNHNEFMAWINKQ